MQTIQDLCFKYSLSYPNSNIPEGRCRTVMEDTCISMYQHAPHAWSAVVNKEGRLSCLLMDPNKDVLEYIGINAHLALEAQSTVLLDVEPGAWDAMRRIRERTLLGNHERWADLRCDSVIIHGNKNNLREMGNEAQCVKIFANVEYPPTWDHTNVNIHVRCYPDWPYQPHGLQANFLNGFSALTDPTLPGELQLDDGSKVLIGTDSQNMLRRMNMYKALQSVTDQENTEKVLFQYRTKDKGILFLVINTDGDYIMYSHGMGSGCRVTPLEFIPADMRPLVLNMARDFQEPGVTLMADQEEASDALDYLALYHIGAD